MIKAKQTEEKTKKTKKQNKNKKTKLFLLFFFFVCVANPNSMRGSQAEQDKKQT